jgi:hypothetical protein
MSEGVLLGPVRSCGWTLFKLQRIFERRLFQYSDSTHVHDSSEFRIDDVSVEKFKIKNTEEDFSPVSFASELKIFLCFSSQIVCKTAKSCISVRPERNLESPKLALLNLVRNPEWTCCSTTKPRSACDSDFYVESECTSKFCRIAPWILQHWYCLCCNFWWQSSWRAVVPSTVTNFVRTWLLWKSSTNTARLCVFRQSE